MNDPSQRPSAFETLELTGGDLVAVRAGPRADREGYERFYQHLAKASDEHGSIRVFEETPGWTGATFLSHTVHGIIPDLRYGPKIRISRYAAVGDSVWAKLMFRLWVLIKPVWPMAPRRMRYFDQDERATALTWLGADQH